MCLEVPGETLVHSNSDTIKQYHMKGGDVIVNVITAWSHFMFYNSITGFLNLSRGWRGGFWFGAAAVRLPPRREIPGGIAAKSPPNPARSRLIFNESTVSCQVPVMTALNVRVCVRLALKNSAPYGWPQGSSHSPSPRAWQHAVRRRRGDYLRRVACQTRGNLWRRVCRSLFRWNARVAVYGLGFLWG